MSQSVSERVLSEVAARRGTDFRDLPPMYETLDPETLDAVVESLDTGSVSFSYAGYDITITSTEAITISPNSIAAQS